MVAFLSFEDTMSKLESLTGEEVEVRAWGREEESASLLDIVGKFGRVRMTEGEQTADEAVVFVVGLNREAQVNIWPDRFVSASPYERNGVSIETLDGIITVALKSRPWID